MADCIRTRRYFSTPLSDISWEREQDRQGSLIAAEERAKEAASKKEEKAARQRVAEIRAVQVCYDFRRDDAKSFFAKDGSPVQLAMALIRRTRAGEVVTVIAKKVGGQWHWETEGAGRAPFGSDIYICAVQARVAKNRADREAAQEGR